MGTARKAESKECKTEEFDTEGFSTEGFDVDEFDTEEYTISSELEEIVGAIAEEETLEECAAFEMIGEDF